MQHPSSGCCREAIEWLRAEGCEWDGEDDEDDDGLPRAGRTMDAALDGYCLSGPWALAGERPPDLSFVRWLKGLGAPWSSGSFSRLVGCKGVDLSTLQWALDDGCPLCDSAGIAAASAGRTDILSWLDSLGALSRRKGLCMAAASDGHLETLTWLRSRGCR